MAAAAAFLAGRGGSRKYFGAAVVLVVAVVAAAVLPRPEFSGKSVEASRGTTEPAPPEQVPLAPAPAAEPLPSSAVETDAAKAAANLVTPVKSAVPAKVAVPTKPSKPEKPTAAAKAVPPTSTGVAEHVAAPATAASSAKASVMLIIIPWGEVYVDGKKRGISPPLKSLALAPGKHSVEIKNSGFPPHLEKIEVKAGTPLRIMHKF